MNTILNAFDNSTLVMHSHVVRHFGMGKLFLTYWTNIERNISLVSIPKVDIQGGFSVKSFLALDLRTYEMIRMLSINVSELLIMRIIGISDVFHDNLFVFEFMQACFNLACIC